MKNILFIFVLFTFIGARSSATHRQWVIGSRSQLLIHGKTNINSYTCSILQFDHFDTLDFSLKREEMIFSGNIMEIPIKNFNCGNITITKDLRRTVKAIEQPNLYITFISLEKGEGQHAAAEMQIKLAGIAKVLHVDFVLSETDGLLQLTGKKEISFDDFHLKAPGHVFGLVKVQPSIVVEFNLMIEPIE